MGLDTALEEQDPGLVSEAVGWVEAEAPADPEPAEAARGVARAAVEPVWAGVCGDRVLVAALERAWGPEVRA